MCAIESAQVVSEEKLLGAWIDAVGEAGFKNAKPYSLSKGVLSVTVKNSSWSQELTLKKRWVVKKLQVILGKDQIHDIRFKTGQL
jgi:predicted nucleic acid-binding Zn ribbon protein